MGMGVGVQQSLQVELPGYRYVLNRIYACDEEERETDRTRTSLSRSLGVVVDGAALADEVEVTRS